MIEFARQTSSSSAGDPARLNAGELRLALQLQSKRPDDPVDEWYAFCFPRPTFTVFHRFVGEVGDTITPLDVMDLWRDIWACKNIIWNQCLRQVVSVSTYLTSWQYPPLSVAVLLSWICVSWKPCWFVPAVLIWVCIWLNLFRRPRWHNHILAHQATASLDQEGYDLISTLGDSKRVAFWVERVVRDQGGQVLSLKALDKFASLIFRNRKPLLTFPALIEALKKERCIKWPERWAPLNDEGLSKVTSSKDARWVVSWLARLVESHDGVVQDQHKLQRFAAERVVGEGPFRTEDVLRALKKQPWIVWRDFGLGEETGGMNDAGWWARLPAWVIPRPVERLAFRLANPIEDFRKTLARFFRWVHASVDEWEVAKQIYFRCTVLCALWSVGTMWVDLNKILFTILGLAAFSHRLPGVRQFVTMRRASADLAECRSRREQGGPELWAFFSTSEYTSEVCSSSSASLSP